MDYFKEILLKIYSILKVHNAYSDLKYWVQYFIIRFSFFFLFNMDELIKLN